MDREKVMNALERCKSYGQCDDDLCPYYREVACLEKLRQDAFALLKKQDAENGEWIMIWQEEDPDTSIYAKCSICNRISERPLGGYCKWCGAKMSQEWGVDG